MGLRPFLFLITVGCGLILGCGDNASVKEKWCLFNGKTHPPGSTFPATGGCGTCTCYVGGVLDCTNDPCQDGGSGENLVKDAGDIGDARDVGSKDTEGKSDTNVPDIVVTPDIAGDKE